MKKETKRVLIWAAVLFVLLLAGELAVSNFTALAARNAEKVSLSLDGATLPSGVSLTEKGLVLGASGSIRFPDVGTEVKTVSVRLSSDSLEAGTLSVSLLDESASQSFRVFTTSRFYTQGTSYFRISSAGECKTLRLEWSGIDGALLEDVTVNGAPPFSMNVLRFLISFALAFLLFLTWEKKWWRHLFVWKNDSDGKESISGLPARRTATLVLILLSLLLVACATQNAGFISLPLSEGESHDAYAQLFSSLLKGKLDLDVPVDVSKLEALNNPYDNTERAFLSGISPAWDRAYFEGKFYCYFGIAPIFAVYFPVYLLSFRTVIPEPGTASLILLLFAFFGIHSALHAMAKVFGIKKPLILTWLSIPATALGFLLPVLASCSDMYYLPISSAYCFFSWTLAFGFGAFLKTKPWVRRLFLGLSGFCLAATVASRPTIAVYGALLIPLFVSWIRKEKKTWWKEACSFALPLTAVVGLIFWYNAARFGSPLEFGARYQLTVHDIRSAGISLSLFGESFVHYFLQSPAYSGTFPYFGPGRLDLASYGVYFYSVRNLGAFHLPAAILPFAGWIGGRKNPVRTATFLLAALLPVFIAFVDCCLAGACIRYLFDVLFPLVLAGILLIWEWGGRISEAQPKSGFGLTVLLGLCLVLTSAAGFALIFSNERNWILSGSPELFRFVEGFFTLR